MSTEAKTATAGAAADSTARRAWVWPMILTVAGLGFLSVRFFEATHEGIANARTNACRALTPDPVPPALLNREAPDFQLPDQHGEIIRLSDQRGKVVVLSFLYTHCRDVCPLTAAKFKPAQTRRMMFLTPRLLSFLEIGTSWKPE